MEKRVLFTLPGQIIRGKCSICSLIDFANENEGIFRGKFVHFGSCRTFKMNDSEIKQFKRLTGAIMVSGYERNVEITTSFIFEAWLLNTLYRIRIIVERRH